MPSRVKKRKEGDNLWLLTVSLGYDENGKQITRTRTVTATSKRAAEKEWVSFSAELNGGIKNKTMKLSEFYVYYNENYEKKNLAPTTIERNEYLFKKIKNIIGHKPIDKITPKDIMLFLNLLERAGLSNNARLREFDFLHSMFNKAVQWQFIKDNPCNHVDTPKKQKVEKKILQKNELEQFLDCVDEHADLEWKCCTYLVLFSGVRSGELFGLQYKHVDIKNKTIFIEQEVIKVKGGIVLNPTTKTKKNRIVSVPSSVISLIKQKKEQTLVQKELLANKWQGAEDIEDDFIFCNSFGAMSHGQRFNHWLNSFLNRYHINHITPHSFRHMTASYLIAAGVDLQTVAGKLGHSTASTTLKTYSHLLLSAEQKTSDTLESIIGR